MNCLLCNKAEQDCRCPGGFKIIFHLGVAKSKKEMTAFEKKSPMEKSLLLTNFMTNRNNDINDKLQADMDLIAETQIKIANKILKAKKK